MSLMTWLTGDKRTPLQKTPPAQSSKAQGSQSGKAFTVTDGVDVMRGNKTGSNENQAPVLGKINYRNGFSIDVKSNVPGINQGPRISLPKNPAFEYNNGIHAVTGKELAGTHTDQVQPPVTHTGGNSPTVAALGNTKVGLPVFGAMHLSPVATQVTGPGAVNVKNPAGNRADSIRSTPTANQVNNGKPTSKLAGSPGQTPNPTTSVPSVMGLNMNSTTIALYVGIAAGLLAVFAFVTGRSHL